MQSQAHTKQSSITLPSKPSSEGNDVNSFSCTNNFSRVVKVPISVGKDFSSFPDKLSCCSAVNEAQGMKLVRSLMEFPLQSKSFNITKFVNPAGKTEISLEAMLRTRKLVSPINKSMEAK